MSLLPHGLPDDFTRRLGETVARSRLSPNALTALGLGTAAAAATLAAHGRFWEAGLVMLTAAGFDVLDGAVALATNKASQFGAIFDAIADRLSEFAMLLALLVWFSAPERADREAIILIAVTIAGSMLVPYTRSKAGEFGVHIRHGLGTRFERVVILAIGLFADQVVAVLWILALLTNLTALQRLAVTWWALRTAPPDDADDQLLSDLHSDD